MDPGICTTIEQWVQSIGKNSDGQAALIRYGVLAAVAFALGTTWSLLFPVLLLGVWLWQTETVRRYRTTYKRDWKALMTLFAIKWEARKRFKADEPLHMIWLEKVARHPEKECCVEVDTGKRISYGELNKRMNQYANYFKSSGCAKDDVVALFMENCIDFYALWMGLSKLGVISAWVNTNLKLEPLAYSINASKCRAIVTTSSLLPTLKKAISEGLIPDSIRVYVNDGPGDGVKVHSLEESVKDSSEEEPPPCPGLGFQSILCYIYTSGTTGNPKPAVMKHFRYYWGAFGIATAFDIRPSDRLYCVMPIYHSAAGVLAIGSTIVLGTTVVIRKKFSATAFWSDAIEHNITVGQYIGELCRYLLTQPSTPAEKQHSIRLMFGNGLRPAIWAEFQSRFAISRIGELYASTEGNSNLINFDGHVGSCGFISTYFFIKWIYPVRILKVDEETGEILRGPDGLCIPARPGEMGEVVGVIRKELYTRFDGYVDSKDTSKKIYDNVFSKGDQVFTTGDIMYWDELGYLYFKDRTGDTFRWKGENVSTTEVEHILQPVKSVVDCTVYGVEVGKAEGRAGMAAIHPAQGVDIETLLTEASSRYTANLASYAIPLFVRICNEVDKTGTFKLKKTELQKSGFDLDKCGGDRLYFWSGGKYTPLTPTLQRQLASGEYRI